jgi:ADP-ribosylglycohydrolase
MEIKDRIKGAFIGLYFGSGINPRISPMATSQEAKDEFGDKSFDEVDRDYQLYDQHTMSKIVYDMLLRFDKISPEIFRDYLLELHKKYDVFKGDVYGPSTQKAVTKIIAGEDVHQMGRTGITCGSAMRTLPVAMFFHNDLNKMIENTVGACVISHNTNIAIEIAIATNITLMSLINGSSKFEAINEGIQKAKELHGKYGEKTSEPKAYEKIQSAVDLLKGKTIQEAMQLIPEKVGVSWFARETIPGAYANYTVTDTPQDSSLLAMRCGGDSQTVPEIACAFMGAEKGSDIFPEEFIRKIEEKNGIKIYDMADKLIEKLGL